MGTGVGEYVIAANHFLQQARESINSISEDEKHSVKALQSLCTCFDYLGKASAIDNSMQVNNLSIPELVADGLMSMAMVHLNSDGNTLSALACLEAAIAIEQKAIYHFMASQLYYRMNIKQSALEHIQSAITLDPHDADYKSALNQIIQES